MHGSVWKNWDGEHQGRRLSARDRQRTRPSLPRASAPAQRIFRRRVRIFRDQTLSEEFMPGISNDIEIFTLLYAQRCAMFRLTKPQTLRKI